MNRVREDEWPTQFPPIPCPPTPAPQQTDTSALGMLKQRGSYTPAYPRPQPESGNQLPPIRNLVPGLWEPGTSKSSKQLTSDEGKDGCSVYRLRPVGPAWSDRPVNGNDRDTPRPQPETSYHEKESNRDVSRQVNESNKRPPSSPIEREDHARTTPPNCTINSSGRIVSHVHKPSQPSNQTGGKPDVRSRSDSEATKPTGESPRSGLQSSHQQGLLRDPVDKLQPWFTNRWLTIRSFYFSIPPYGNF